MIVIEGTDKIRGMLDLSSVNLQMKRGDKYPITEQQFTDNKVQVAIRMGLIKKVGEEENSTFAGQITLKNIYDRSIHLNALEAEIRPGQTFTLTEDQMNSADIRGALAKGMIDVISSARTASISEGNVNIGKLFEDAEDKKVISKVTEEESEEKTIDYLETNEEASEPKEIKDSSTMFHEPPSITSENPKPVNTKDIPDPKRKSVIWNPNADPVPHTRTGMNKMSAGEKVGKDQDKISFVDKELEEERIKSHPKLKDKEISQDVDLDFL